MAQEIPQTVRVLCGELIQQLETAPEAGSVYRRTLDGIDYIYAKVALGAARIDRFIGKVGDPVAEEKAASLTLGTKLAAERRRLISLLRHAGLSSPDRTMGAVLDVLSHAGLFRSGGVIVGTGAYLTYEAHVGVRLPSPTLMTGDLDLAAASVGMAPDWPDTFTDLLRRADASFTGLPQLTRNALPCRFRNDKGYLVDLLTPTRSRSDSNPVALEHLGAGAAPLQHLEWLIDGAIWAAALWGSGVLIKIPQPARFAVHKLILAQRRDAANHAKRSKDLKQAKALIEALRHEDPFSLEDALADAKRRGVRGWSQPIARSLAELGYDGQDILSNV